MDHQKIAETPRCFSEYGQLEQVVLCTPQYMRIVDIINETQRSYVEENIQVNVAIEQHQKLVSTLEEAQVEVILIPPDSQLPEQVFTRDIAFTIGENIFIGNMQTTIRNGEEKIFQNMLDQRGISYHTLKSGTIEGGDVIIDDKKVWIGIGNRSSEPVLRELQNLLPDYHITPVPFNPRYLHLDCVFNPISAHEALIFSPAFPQESLDLLSDSYDLIEVTEKEQFQLCVNLIALGEKKVVTQPLYHELNRELEQRGFHLVHVDISEIIKSGGGFRCITMPLVRRR
ncbi:dimethylarginine dimethylaminohydrolase family protein [Hazenella coriacea]|uniref:N-dimethylarginine dimethylaminohydrolase n=1 Tax=Hazenella coriacea TaxID=1179467 RepID=A0A4R3LCJ7_9BACL|nr:arginine deiminase family protein [Hazenella coriacea]TCS97010.1 N-dimethylarginine dimethylaminohydrolase [Hazenella coriacea]